MRLLGPGRGGSKQLFSKMTLLGRGRDVSKQQGLVTSQLSGLRQSSRYFVTVHLSGPCHSLALGTSAQLSGLRHSARDSKAAKKSQEGDSCANSKSRTCDEDLRAVTKSFVLLCNPRKTEGSVQVIQSMTTKSFT